jgi:hypothetical protein
VLIAKRSRPRPRAAIVPRTVGAVPGPVREPPLHVRADEAGLGDNLCWSRFLGPLCLRTKGVTLECDARLVPLMRYSFPDVAVMALEAQPRFAAWTPLRYLQVALEINDNDAPRVPYLRANPDRVDHYRRLVPSGAIGIAWCSPVAGGPFMPFAEMLPLVERFSCVSLQGGGPRVEIARTAVLDLLPCGASFLQPDFAEAAALISALRAVVTVDTCVMHLAGALGVAAHMCLRPQGERRRVRRIPGSPEIARWNGWWGPMYPSVCGYVSQGEWGRDCIAHVAAALAAFPRS